MLSDKNQKLPFAFNLLPKISDFINTTNISTNRKIEEHSLNNSPTTNDDDMLNGQNEENVDSNIVYGNIIMGGEAKYVGNLTNGKKHGYGILKFKDGLEYKGQFFDNNICGYGIVTCREKKYEGFWQNNQKNGEGVEVYNDGRLYKGNFSKDKKEGYGEFKWANGSQFKGNFKNGRQEGEGIFITSTGVVKRGIWKNGKRVNWIDVQKGKESNLPSTQNNIPNSPLLNGDKE